MSGIKDLLILFYWMDNNQASTLEASLREKDDRKVPRERQIILNDLKKEAPAPEKGIRMTAVKPTS